MLQTLKSKQGDYTVNEDRVFQFKAIAEWTGLSPLQVWEVLFFKHVTAIRSFILKGETSAEQIQHRTMDVANYCVLLEALIEDATTWGGHAVGTVTDKGFVESILKTTVEEFHETPTEPNPDNYDPEFWGKAQTLRARYEKELGGGVAVTIQAFGTWLRIVDENNRILWSANANEEMYNPPVSWGEPANLTREQTEQAFDDLATAEREAKREREWLKGIFTVALEYPYDKVNPNCGVSFPEFLKSEIKDRFTVLVRRAFEWYRDNRETVSTILASKTTVYEPLRDYSAQPKTDEEKESDNAATHRNHVEQLVSRFLSDTMLDGLQSPPENAGPEDNPRDDEPATKEEYEKWEAEQDDADSDVERAEIINRKNAADETLGEALNRGLVENGASLKPRQVVKAVRSDDGPQTELEDTPENRERFREINEALAKDPDEICERCKLPVLVCTCVRLGPIIRDKIKPPEGRRVRAPSKYDDLENRAKATEELAKEMIEERGVELARIVRIAQASQRAGHVVIEDGEDGAIVIRRNRGGPAMDPTFDITQTAKGTDDSVAFQRHDLLAPDAPGGMTVDP